MNPWEKLSERNVGYNIFISPLSRQQIITHDISTKFIWIIKWRALTRQIQWFVQKLFWRSRGFHKKRLLSVNFPERVQLRFFWSNSMSNMKFPGDPTSFKDVFFLKNLCSSEISIWVLWGILLTSWNCFLISENHQSYFVMSNIINERYIYMAHRKSIFQIFVKNF